MFTSDLDEGQLRTTLEMSRLNAMPVRKIRWETQAGKWRPDNSKMTKIDQEETMKLTAFGHQSLKQTNGGIRDEEAERVLAEEGTD